MIRAIVAALWLAAAAPAIAVSPPIIVPMPLAATPATLVSVLTSALGGSVVSLAPGDYGDVYIRGKSARAYTPPITINGSAATFRSLRFDGVSGLRLNDLSLKGGGVSMQYGSSDIVINGVLSIGSPRSGVAIGGGHDIKVFNGEFIDAGSDGVDIRSSQRIEVRGFVCYGSAPTPGAHPDCAQAYGKVGEPALEDITIADAIAIGDTQGFDLFGNNVAATRVKFDNLTVFGRYSRGVSMTSFGGCADCILSNSRVMLMRGAQHIVQLDPLTAGGNWSGTITNNSGNSARPR